MKKKNGFTLSELLGVVVILALLMLLVFPSLINRLKEGKLQISSSVETLIFNATGNYINNNLNDYPVNIDTTYCFTLEQLVEAGELTKGLLIDENGKSLDLNKKVIVKIEEQKKVYEMADKCPES